MIARGLPNIEANLNVGKKYDGNTCDFYQEYADGDTIEVDFADNAVTPTLRIYAQYGHITADLNPADNDGAAFIDVPLRLAASTSGNVLEVII